MALYSLGEIGRQINLSSQSDLEQTLLNCFDSSNEETRQAASFALGNVAVGSLNTFMPKILDQIQSNIKARYLLLHSLREVKLIKFIPFQDSHFINFFQQIIVRLSTTAENVTSLRVYQSKLLPLLYQYCEEEEGIRNVVAECLGKLALISPNELIPTFISALKAPKSEMRATVVTALKFSIIDKPQEVDTFIQPNMPQFLDLLKDQDLVRLS